MRELQLWVSEDGLETTFADVEELAAQCRFFDCGHDTEPGCAVKDALRDGRLDAERLASWRKLGRELRRLEIRLDKRARAEEAKSRRAFYRQIKAKSKASPKR
jgi:ribosome biogenesis GTPase